MRFGPAEEPEAPQLPGRAEVDGRGQKSKKIPFHRLSREEEKFSSKFHSFGIHKWKARISDDKEESQKKNSFLPNSIHLAFTQCKSSLREGKKIFQKNIFQSNSTHVEFPREPISIFRVVCYIFHDFSIQPVFINQNIKHLKKNTWQHPGSFGDFPGKIYLFNMRTSSARLATLSIWPSPLMEYVRNLLVLLHMRPLHR